MAQQLNDDANEQLLNDDISGAIETYSKALEKCESWDKNLQYTILVGRSQAYLKCQKYQQALDDASAAIAIDSNDHRAYLKQGIALYNLKDYEKSLISLQHGQELAGSNEIKRNMFNDWIEKCKKEVTPKVVPKTEEPTVVVTTPVVPPSIKHEWYQTESHVTVCILAKNTNSNDVDIISKPDLLSIQSKDQEKLKINFNFNLAFPVLAEQTQIKFLSSKIEIKLKKTEVNQWKKLEREPEVKETKKVEQKPYYPSSSTKPKDWDKIVVDINEEEKNEKLDGDAALNKLFKDVYSNGSDEVRKAMNKSFVESGGTVLSTNWQDVGKKKLDVKPPDGMEFKSWDQ